MCCSWFGWWVGLLPGRIILPCVSVVTRCCEDGEQMEANCSWSVQYHASGGKTLKKNYTSVFSAFASAAKFWYWNEPKCRVIKESDIWKRLVLNRNICLLTLLFWYGHLLFIITLLQVKQNPFSQVQQEKSIPQNTVQSTHQITYKHWYVTVTKKVSEFHVWDINPFTAAVCVSLCVCCEWE